MQMHIKLILLALVFCLAAAGPVRDDREPELLKVENEREIVLIRKQRVVKEFAKPTQFENGEAEVKNVQKRMADDDDEAKAEKHHRSEESEGEAEKHHRSEESEAEAEKHHRSEESEAEKMESNEPLSEKLKENDDEVEAEIAKKSPSALKKKAKTTTTVRPPVVEVEKSKMKSSDDESNSERLVSEDVLPTKKDIEKRETQQTEIENLPLESEKLVSHDDQANIEKREAQQTEIENLPLESEKLVDADEQAKIEKRDVELESIPIESSKLTNDDQEVKVERRDAEVENAPIEAPMVSEEKEVRVEREALPDKFDVNELCDLSSQFNYYLPHPTDPAKYIQCDPWGTSEIRTCLNNTIWDSWSYKCALKEDIKNITVQFPSGPSKANMSLVPVKCTSNEVECLNGGYCMIAYGEPKCVCSALYTGEFCEINVNQSDLYHQILAGNFSIEDFKKRLYEENVTTDKSYYEKYRSKLDNVTYNALIQYLSLYQKDDIRYDTLVTILMEDILDNMYPDAKYLSMFNASSQSVIDMVQMIPSLLSFSKYSFERYDKVFAEFQRVLDKLVEYFKVSIPRIKLEASEYTKLTYLFLNKTVQGTIFKSENTSQLMIQDAVSESIRFNEGEVRDSIRDNFNSTLQASTKLFELFDSFQNAVLAESQVHPGVLNMTLAQSKITGAVEIVRLFEDISGASAQIWDSLVNYGFWYITNAFAEDKKEVL